MFRDKYLDDSYMDDDLDRCCDEVFDPPKGVCSCCGNECYIVKIDEGYDGYEYGSYRGTHHNYVYVSHCCGSDIGGKENGEI